MKPLIRQSVASLQAYTPGEQPRDRSLVKLNTNENPYPPSPRVTACLRERIGALHGCAPESVFVGNGSDEVLALCTRAFVENDGAVGYFVPSYSLYPVLADIREVERRPVALGPGFGWVDPPRDSGALFFVTNPNAPTGMLFPGEALRAFCDRHDGVVVIDEAYVDFAREDCLDVALSRPNVLVSRTLSKSYSLAGLRLGYAVGAPALIRALIKIKDSYNVDALSQAVAAAALEDQAHMRANADCIRATRCRVSEALQGIGWEVSPSETNFLWARPAGIPADEAFQRLRQRHILVRHFAGERTGAFLRVTVGTDDEADRFIEAAGELTGGGSRP